ncbi:MAG TPA: amino acid adenylation domain-containing protein [Thermoanaerobaculia bacterium]
MIEISSRLEGLSPQKRELLLRQLRQMQGEAPRPVIRPRGGSLGDFPLSYAQQRLWFLDQLEPGNPFYNLPGAVRLPGPVDEDALRRALAEIVRRHEILRTTFPAVAGTPVQRVGVSGELPLSVIDLSGLAESERRAVVRHHVNLEVRRPFDLSAGPLFRFLLLRLGPSERILAFSIHHIVFDGWSMRVLVRELTALYHAFSQGVPSPLPELPVQFADYAMAERTWLDSEALVPQLEYWKSRLAALPGPLELPADRPRPEVQTFRGARQGIVLPPATFAALKERGQTEKATPFMAILAGFKTLLCRYTGREDLVVGTPMANRDRVETEGLIGFFVNTLVLRDDLSEDPSFRELLARVRSAALEAFAHPDLPFERLVEELQPERDLAHTPVFQALFAFQSIPVDTRPSSGGGLAMEAMPVEAGKALFDLTLSLEEINGRVAGFFEYNTDLFDADRMRRMAAHFEILLTAAAAEPDRRLSDLPLLTPAESQQLLREWSRGELSVPGTRLLHQMVEEQADRRPEAVALVFEDGELTYGELDRRANRLARRLRRLGVGPETRVGLSVERSPEMIVGLLAVLKAGGAYVPLDPAYPAERLDWLRADSGLSVLLTAAELSGDPDESGERLPPSAGPDNLAYVIYTSGSTGTPKGVLVSHRGLDNLAEAQGHLFGIGPDSRVLQFASMSFDASVSEIAMTFRAGAALVLAGRLALSPGPELIALLRDREITAATLPPSVLAALPEADLPALRTIVVAGEACPVDLARRWAAGRRLVNAYGPTETTVCATAWVYDGGDRLPIGGPIRNMEAYVFAHQGGPAPMGVPGELLVGGVGLARGYHGRPDLTAERFVPHPFASSPGERLYRTGDLVRFRADGCLDYLGRIDRQVKVRGFRVELGEIEAVLESHPAVERAVVLASPDSQSLAAWVVSRDPAATPAGWRAFLRDRLPDYMVPAGFVILESLPLTPSGKVDRRALAAVQPRPAAATGDRIAPRTPSEEILAGIWEGILGAEGIGAHDNFFDLGGHSLLATRMMSRVLEAFGVELPLRALFEAPTVAGLAARIETALAEGRGVAAPPIVPVPRHGRLPLSFGQQRLWFLDQLERGTAAYNMPSAVRLRGTLDPGVLAGGLTAMVERHEALRTVFLLPEGEDEPVQHILPAAPVPLPLVDLDSLPRGAREAESRRLAAAEARRSFDLARGPLLRTLLLRLGGEEHMLLLTLHHIVGDGWSMGVLMRELAALHAAIAAGCPSPLPALPVQYADYAAWQRGWLTGEVLATQIAFWRDALAGAPPLLDLPTDRPRPPMQTFRGSRRTLALPAGLAQDLHKLGRASGATSFMVLLAAFQTLLHRYSGQGIVVVGSPIANRNRAEIEGLIGFFVNTLALATDLSGEPGFLGLLARVREGALGAYAHQDLPFEKIVEELSPERNLAHAPLFQVLFAFQAAAQPAEAPPAAEGGLALSTVEADMAATKFDLTLNVEERGRGLAAALEFNTDLFDPATAGRLLEQLRALLEAAVAAPEERISELPLLGEAQRAQLLVEWNDTAVTAPAWDCLHELFHEQARRAPDDPALIATDGTLTWSELAGRVRQLAAFLRGLSVGPEVLVGICMERTLDIVVGILGVLEAGGAYLPLDPVYPRERLDFMLADAGAPVVLTQERMLGRLGIQENGEGPRWICLDRDWPAIAAAPPAPPSGVRPDNLAYVIYTSGSTGRPKGVAIAHFSPVALLRWASGVLPEDYRAGVLASTSICFDLSVFELFLPLCFGGTVVLAETALHLPHLAAAPQVTLVNTVPSAIAELVRGGGLPASVRAVTLAGEPLPRKLVDEIYAVETVERVMNLYGPSEDTTYSTYATIDRSGGQPPIGRPVGEGWIYILDAAMQPVPLGVPGELCLGGAGLARVYLNRPELTAERFVPDPLSGVPGSRLYRTGDLARFRPDGEMLFLGRVDHQVKIRGFRIELGEIEATLRQHPGVAETLVVAKRGGEPGDVRLVAYVVGREGEAPPVEELRAFLRAKLPAHMVPWAFVPLAAFPLNANGKIERKALPDPERAAWGAAAEIEEPRSEMERRVAAVWRELLGLDRVGIHDNFFDSGGHSLLAVRVHSRLKRELGREFPLVALFEHPTIGALARHLDKGEADPASREKGQDRGARRREALAARRRAGRPAGNPTENETEEP